MKGIRIRPEQTGLRAALFDLEADIMETVWTKGWQEFTVADVHRELERHRTIAYTTAMTTVARLHEKGLLDRACDGQANRSRWSTRPTRGRAASRTSAVPDCPGLLVARPAGIPPVSGVCPLRLRA
jgi:hypothetical protein